MPFIAQMSHSISVGDRSFEYQQHMFRLGTCKLCDGSLCHVHLFRQVCVCGS